MTAIFKRELKSYFHGMMGYVLTAFLLATSGLYFLALDLGYGMTDFSYYTLYRTIFILLLYIPVLAMRSLAEERRSRTDQLLLTSPVSVWGIVLGKFFAMAVIFAIPCLVDAVMILILWGLGSTTTALAANFAGLLCYFLLGCAAIAIGGVPLRSDGKPDHCRRYGRGSAAAGLHDAQPAHHVQRGQCRGAGGFYRAGGSSLRAGGAAHPELYTGMSAVRGPLHGAVRPLPLKERLADQRVQHGAERTVPVYPL